MANHLTAIDLQSARCEIHPLGYCHKSKPFLADSSIHESEKYKFTVKSYDFNVKTYNFILRLYIFTVKS